MPKDPNKSDDLMDFITDLSVRHEQRKAAIGVKGFSVKDLCPDCKKKMGM